MAEKAYKIISPIELEHFQFQLIPLALEFQLISSPFVLTLNRHSVQLNPVFAAEQAAALWQFIYLFNFPLDDTECSSKTHFRPIPFA